MPNRVSKKKFLKKRFAVLFKERKNYYANSNISKGIVYNCHSILDAITSSNMGDLEKEASNLAQLCEKMSVNTVMDYYIFERASFCFDEEFLFHIKRSAVDKDFLASCIDFLHSTTQQNLGLKNGFTNSILLCITVSLGCFLQDSVRVRQSFDIIQKIKISKRMARKIIFCGTCAVDQLSVDVIKEHFMHPVFNIKKYGASNLLYQICNHPNKELVAQQMIDFYMSDKKEQKTAFYREIFRLKGIIGDYAWIQDQLKAKDPVDYFKVLNMEKRNIVLSSRLFGGDRAKAIVEFINAHFSPAQKLELFYTIIKKQKQSVVPVLEKVKAQKIANIIYEYPKILTQEIDWIRVIKSLVVKPTNNNKRHNVSAGAVELVELLFKENNQKINFSTMSYLLHNKWKMKHLSEVSKDNLQAIKHLSAQWLQRMEEIKDMQEITKEAAYKTGHRHKI